MNKNVLPALVLLALALAPTAHAALGDPAEAAASTPLRYQSAFSDYKPWQDLQPGNWRALNDALVSKPAGHVGHGTAPVPAGGSTTAPAKPAPRQPAPGGAHDGHHMHGSQK